MSVHTAVIVIVLVCGLTSPAFGYYDDVHYVLTYYVARQVGYTHVQASRLASADVSIDWDPPTEPVQAGLASLNGLPKPQLPRWRFHAFRNEIKFNDVIGASAGEGSAADNMIRTQRTKLWMQGLDDKNLGAFLHFFQDEVPHAGYGSDGGHWPLFVDNARFRKHYNEGLPVGGTTDWLPYRSVESNMQLARNTATVLTRFMKIVSPRQKSNPLNEDECRRFIEGLRAANQPPPPLEGESLKVFVKVFAKPELIGYWTNKAEFDVEQTANIRKHVEGTDLKAAMQVLEGAIPNCEFSEHHHQFHYDEDGRFQPGQNQQISTRLTVHVEDESLEATSITNGSVRLLMSSGAVLGLGEYALTELQPLDSNGEVVFEDVPMGAIQVEMVGESGAIRASEVMEITEANHESWLLVRPLEITRDLDTAIDRSYGANVDLVVAFDTTSSMSSSINSIRDRAIETIREMGERSKDLRLGLVSFRDHDDDASDAIQAWGFTRDIESQINRMKSLKAEKGGDLPEDMYAGVMEGIRFWEEEQEAGAVDTTRTNVVKLVVVITDAPAKRPDFQGNTPESVAQAAFEVDPAHIYPIIVGGNMQAISDGKELATLTGGRMIHANSGDDVAHALIEAIDTGVRSHGGNPLREYRPVLFWLFTVGGIALAAIGFVILVFPSIGRRRK